ncbi:unnamed protein product, partial [marine sediment metagenome]
MVKKKKKIIIVIVSILIILLAVGLLAYNPSGLRLLTVSDTLPIGEFNANDDCTVVTNSLATGFESYGKPGVWVSVDSS